MTLACDGTHIGVSVGTIMLDHGGVTGVDEPDLNSQHQTQEI